MRFLLAIRCFFLILFYQRLPEEAAALLPKKEPAGLPPPEAEIVSGPKVDGKAFVTARMREVVAWSREIFGGNGIVLDYDIARFFADAEAIYSFEGTREMNTLIVGKAITGQSAFI